jgi:hypothetical protein
MSNVKFLVKLEDTHLTQNQTGQSEVMAPAVFHIRGVIIAEWVPQGQEVKGRNCGRRNPGSCIRTMRPRP